MSSESSSQDVTSPFQPANPFTDEDAFERAGMMIAGRYRLLEAIGEGGMGSVWVAEQIEPVRRKVAIKFIKAGMDSKAVLVRFEAERQALAVMDHPNIAKVLDGGRTDDGRPFFVMEYVQGVPITTYCDQARLSVRERLELMVPVCQAVQHAHQKGIIHRDLKPSNILVSQTDGKPAAKVIDFGLAKAIHQPLTDSSLFTVQGMLIGTPLYMSPEQADLSNIDIDTRTDIYSLGVILYELLTGTTPLDRQEFRKAAWQEALRLIKEAEPLRPSSRISGNDSLPSVAAQRMIEPSRLSRVVRGELDWIAMKCLEKDRSRRYETAAGLALDLQRYLSGEPVRAAPPSAIYVLRKTLRRHKGPVTAAAALLLMLVLGIAGTTWGMVRADWHRHRAEAKEKDANIQKNKALAAANSERLAKIDAQNQKRAAELAAKAEKAAKEAAERRLGQIEKSVEFLAGLLTGLNPRADQRGGPPLYEQLRARAARAADQLDGEAIGDPLAVARLQTILGNTLHELGDDRKALEVLKRARATREDELGRDHADTWITVLALATVHQSRGEFAEAIPLYEQLRDAHVKKLGATHARTLATQANLGHTYFQAGRTAEAIELLEKVRDAQESGGGSSFGALGKLANRLGLADKVPSLGNLAAAAPATARKLFGETQQDRLSVLNNLAMAYQAAGRTPEAIELLEQVRNERLAALGAENFSTLGAQHNLAAAYEDVGRVPEAIALFEEVRDFYEKELGAQHPDTLVVTKSLACAYRSAGELTRAIGMLEQVRDAQVAILEPEHPAILVTWNELALAYQKADRVDEAISLLEKAREVHARKLGTDHYGTFVVTNNLATAYRQAGRLTEAIAIYEQVLEAHQAKLGPDHPWTLTAKSNMGVAYQEAGQLPKAIALLEAVQAAELAKHGPDHPGTIRTMSNLTNAYRLAKRLPEAVDFGERSAAGVEKGGYHHEYAGDIIRNTMRAYEDAGQFERAESWHRKWLDVVSKRHGAESSAYTGELAAWGLALLRQEKWQDAEEVWRKCLNIRERQEPDSWKIYSAKTGLGGALLGQKKYEEAEPLLVAGYGGLKERREKIPVDSRRDRLSEGLQRLVQLYEGLEKPDEAARWKEELSALPTDSDSGKKPD